MKNKNKLKPGKRLNFFVLICLMAITLSAVYIINKSFFNKKSKSLLTLDTPDYYPADNAIPYYNLKWFNNLKYDAKGILTTAEVRTVNEGRITRISFDHGEINVDKKDNVNYPYVVRIELINPGNSKKEVLYFSRFRFEKAQIFRPGTEGNMVRIGWNDIKVGDQASIEENIDLLISNTDSQKKFTDNYVKSLTIILK